MNQAEAQDVIDILGAATNSRTFDAKKLELWTSLLTPLDVSVATEAAVKGIRNWEFFPSWAQYYEMYQAVRGDRARAEGMIENEEVLRRGEKAPEWVYVWMWARQLREPPEERSFPQQRDWADEETLMNQDDFEALKKEWAEAGRPKLLPAFATKS